MTPDNIDTEALRELEAKATPGPWVWGTMYAGPEDEYGVSTFGPIDVLAFKSTGYDGNPILATEAVSENGDRFHVIGAGGGEYMPYDNPHDAVLIAALRNAAPALLAAYAERDALMAEVERLRAEVEFVRANVCAIADKIVADFGPFGGLAASTLKAAVTPTPEERAALRGEEAPRE